MTPRLLALATLLPILLTTAQQNDRVDVFWTATSPVVDGKMDDPCWRDAQPIANFKTRAENAQRTEVRLTWDGANLYLFWTLDEADMDSVVLGEPEVRKDQFERQRGPNRNWVDAVELQIYPGPRAADFLMFISSPLGARYDLASKGAWSDYDPDWQSVPGRFAGGWTLEQRIPFAELAQPGAGATTPQVGDRWRIQMYRKKFAPPEVSSWGCGEPPPPDCINVTFHAPQAGPPPPRVTVHRPDICYGVGTFVLDVQGAAGAAASCRVFRGNEQVDESTATLAGAAGELRLPLHLKQAGDYRIRYTVTQDGRVVFSGQEIAALPPLTDMFPHPTPAELRLPASARPEDAAVKAGLDRFQAAQREAQALVARQAELTDDDWQRVAALRTELVAAWPKLRRDMALLALAPAPGQLFGVGVGTENDKFYPDTLYRGSLTDPVRLALAGGEYGSFQLAVVPFWTNLDNVTVSFSALRGPVEIAADNLTWYRVGYVKLEEPGGWLHLQYKHTHEPDPLLPAAPFAVADGILAPVWVDAFLPPGTPAGVYRGTVSVIANGQRQERPLEIECYGFDIPKTSSIDNEFWWTPGNWRKFYHNRMKYTPELHARHAATLGRYRVSSFPVDWITICPQVKITAEPDGHFTFDWSVFDQYVENARANGTTAYWSALSCNSGWTRYLHNPNVKVFERATGKTVPLARYIPPVESGWVPLDKMPYRENRVYRDFLTAYVAHLKELGTNDRSWYELFDEPGGDRFLDMRRHHQFFRELVPDLHLFNFGMYPTQTVDGKDALGLVDAWPPHVNKFADPDVLPSMYERRAKHGEKLWFYTCIEFRLDENGELAYHAPYTEDNYTPFCVYHRPYIAQRIHTWMAWKYKMDGFYIFMLSAVPTPNTEGEKRWPEVEWSEGRQQGSGTLVYPGADYSIVPGMRLANVREGLEDYEYFAVLRDRAAKLDPQQHAALLARVNAALAVDDTIVRSVVDWTKDRERLEAKRRELAALIREVGAAD